MLTNNNPWLLRIAGVLIVLLLIVNTFLLRHYLKTVNRIDLQKEKSVDQKLAALELEAAYHKAMNELNELQSNSDSMNVLIEEQKVQLTQQRDRIATLLKNGKDPEQLQSEITKFKAQSQRYLNQIKQLQKENEELLAVNEGLTQQTHKLSGKVKQFEGIIESQDSLTHKLKKDSAILEKEKEQLLHQKNQIEKDKTKLANALNKAAIIGVGQFRIIPQNERKNHKLKENDKAHKINQFSFCFNMQMNTQVNEGTFETFEILLKNAEGKIITNNEGEYLESNTTNIYTAMMDVEYQINKPACINWRPKEKLILPGKYIAEIYNKGFQVAKDSVMIR